MKTKASSRLPGKSSALPAPDASGLKAKKESLERGERAAARAFKLEKLADGTIRRTVLNPETHRRKISKAWNAQTEVTRARRVLALNQEEFAGLLGIGLATLRSWEQGRREPSKAAKMLIAIAIRHPEILREKGLFPG